MNAEIMRRTLNEREAAYYVGLSQSTLRHGRSDGQRDNRVIPPPYLKLGRTIRYLVNDLDRWLADRRVENPGDTHEPG